MIELPKRSVTRFFIPLIDVLTLLFCIYLLLPIVEKRDETAVASEPSGRKSVAHEARSLTEEERRELERLRQRGRRGLQERLAVRVLDIDADSGKLFHFDPERVEIQNEADALALIERERRDARTREIYYLFLYPRRLTGFPEERQIKQYKRWFSDVAHGFDNPRAGR